MRDARHCAKKCDCAHEDGEEGGRCRREKIGRFDERLAAAIGEIDGGIAV